MAQLIFVYVSLIYVQTKNGGLNEAQSAAVKIAAGPRPNAH